MCPRHFFRSRPRAPLAQATISKEWDCSPPSGYSRDAICHRSQANTFFACGPIDCPPRGYLPPMRSEMIWAQQRMKIPPISPLEVESPSIEKTVRRSPKHLCRYSVSRRMPCRGGTLGPLGDVKPRETAALGPTSKGCPWSPIRKCCIRAWIVVLSKSGVSLKRSIQTQGEHLEGAAQGREVRSAFDD
jgi:hypothetical protein